MVGTDLKIVQKYYQQLAKKKAYSFARFEALKQLVKNHREEFLAIVHSEREKVLPRFQEKFEATLKSYSPETVKRIADRIQSRKGL